MEYEKGAAAFSAERNGLVKPFRSASKIEQPYALFNARSPLALFMYDKENCRRAAGKI